MTSNCTICNKPFKEGDFLQGFLRSPNDPSGSWTVPAEVDAEYQQRMLQNPSTVKKRHPSCVSLQYMTIGSKNQ